MLLIEMLLGDESERRCFRYAGMSFSEALEADKRRLAGEESIVRSEELRWWRCAPDVTVWKMIKHYHTLIYKLNKRIEEFYLDPEIIEEETLP